jgi:pyridoxal phosphate enzyme (YggS family)
MTQDGAFRIETSLAERLAEVRGRIRAAAERAGRDPREVRLVGASKTVAAEQLIEAVRAGLTDVGENRVQEAEAKAPAVEGAFASAGAPTWHLIGHLQSNKARRAVALFDWIHSLATPALGDALDRIAGELGRRPRVLIEVNVAEEAAKAGVAPGAAPALALHVARLPHLELVGLMTVGPLVATAEEARPAFRRVRALLDEARRAVEAGAGSAAAARLVELSMGMSADYEVAIAEGATVVRVGSALFGARPGAVTG